MAVETNKASGGEPFFRSHARFLVISAVFLSFTLDSFARYPIPGPNESHYLCKAKHYWDPEWCPVTCSSPRRTRTSSSTRRSAC